jgi:peptidylprolyl isomerase
VLHSFIALALFSLQTPPTPPPAPKPPPIPADTEIVTTASGLKYSILKPGDGGAHPKKGDLVKMHYTGWLTDGTVFDSSVQRGQPLEFTVDVGRMFKGWDEATLLMSKGEKMKLTLPPELGNGASPRGKIPANATLIFEVELIDFTPMPQFKPGNKDAQKKTDSGFTYEVITPSSGALPTAGDVVSLKFALFSGQGDLMQCSDREGHGQLITNQLESLPIPAFVEGAKVCHVGERVRIEAPAKLAFGERMQPGTPPDSITVWEIELVAIKKPLPVPPFSLTPPDKLTKTASGLGYEVLREGTGKSPAVGKQVTLHYAGWLTNGTLFDSSFTHAEPMVFRYSGRGLVQAWLEGLPLMKEGAIYKFTVPPELGYGKPGDPPDIPPDATLIFYIELISVTD